MPLGEVRSDPQNHLLVLGGSGPLDPAERRWIDWLHCASTQSDIVKNYVKWTEEPTTPQWHLDAIAKAHKVALTAPRGPVYVTLDCGIQEQKINGALNKVVASTATTASGGTTTAAGAFTVGPPFG